jgi:putative FmdB family regulatory protein
MPIYAYKCESCGHAKDVLQKMSDAPLSVCPACAAATFKKQLTAAGFQLKGSGWYVTDFRGDNGAKPTNPADGDSSSPAAPGADAKPAESGTGAAPATAPVASKPAAVAAAPAATSDSSSSSSKTS